jgi:hypothetical protein
MKMQISWMDGVYVQQIILVGVKVRRMAEGMILWSLQPPPTIKEDHRSKFFWRMATTRLKVGF